MRLIDADELMEHVWRDKLDSRELIAKMVENAPTETVTEFADRCKECEARYGKLLKQKSDKWIPISEDLLEDGKWYLFTDGKNMSVERYKADALDHFCPPGRWFQFDEAVGWMPLPVGPYEEVKKMTREETKDLDISKEIGEQMEFPETFERFAKEYSFKDDKEVYTNGSDLIPIFRVEQWLEHDNKLRRIETDTAYECGKHANKWISVSERLPEENGRYLTHIKNGPFSYIMLCDYIQQTWCPDDETASNNVTYWMPLPVDPYEEVRND